MDLEFITANMFLSLAGCLTIVAIITQALKQIPKLDKINPMIICLIVSVLVGALRIYFQKDFSADAIILGVLNIFVIFLGATGGYEMVKQIGQGVKSIGGKK